MDSKQFVIVWTRITVKYGLRTGKGQRNRTMQVSVTMWSVSSFWESCPHIFKSMCPFRSCAQEMRILLYRRCIPHRPYSVLSRLCFTLTPASTLPLLLFPLTYVYPFVWVTTGISHGLLGTLAAPTENKRAERRRKAIFA